MICCDNKEKWFHYSCLKLTEYIPKGKYYCPECHKKKLQAKKTKKYVKITGELD